MSRDNQGEILFRAMKPSHRQREVGLSPAECIQHAPTEKQQMKRVKELFQDIKWFAVALYALAFIREGGEA